MLPSPIRTVSVPCCPVCQRAGRVRHRELEDRLFGAPGRWQMRQCSHRRCATLWLDPAPHPDDLAEVYRQYYTHAVAPGVSPELLDDVFHCAWAAWRLGYPSPGWLGRKRTLRLLCDLREQERAEFFRFYLPWSATGGRVLDVGCGAGNELILLNRLGWRAEGLDPDPAAVAAATRAGLTVAQGDLLAAGYEENAFDAVTMSHVVEHLPDPVAHLRAARRLLRPGGRLVVITPNAASWGHRIYGPDWRGLEPPRHLQIFSLPSLVRTLRAAGFGIERARTSARDAGYLMLFSENLRAGQRGPGASSVAPGTWPPERLRTREYLEGLAARLRLNIGEELRVVARKPHYA